MHCVQYELTCCMAVAEAGSERLRAAAGEESVAEAVAAAGERALAPKAVWQWTAVLPDARLSAGQALGGLGPPVLHVCLCAASAAAVRCLHARVQAPRQAKCQLQDKACSSLLMLPALTARVGRRTRVVVLSLAGMQVGHVPPSVQSDGARLPAALHDTLCSLQHAANGRQSPLARLGRGVPCCIRSGFEKKRGKPGQGAAEENAGAPRRFAKLRQAHT